MTEEDIRQLATADATVATLLPTAAFFFVCPFSLPEN
jgi:hypothetical protein